MKILAWPGKRFDPYRKVVIISVLLVVFFPAAAPAPAAPFLTGYSLNVTRPASISAE